MQIALKISSLRPAFEQGERLGLVATVSNTGAGPVVVDGLEDRANWTITVGEWKLVTRSAMPPAPPRALELAPGQSREIPLEVGPEHAFEATTKTAASRFPRRHLLAGVYTVVVKVGLPDGGALEARLENLQIRARAWTSSKRKHGRPDGWDRTRWLTAHRGFQERIATLQKADLREIFPSVRRVIEELTELARLAGHLVAVGAVIGAPVDELWALAALGGDLAEGLFCMRVIDSGSIDTDLGPVTVSLPAAGADRCMDAELWVEGFLLAAIGRRPDACTVLARIKRARYEGAPAVSPPHLVAFTDVLRAFWTEEPVGAAVAELEAACKALTAEAERTARDKEEAKLAAEQASAGADHAALVQAVQDRSTTARLAAHRLDHALETRALARALAAALADRPADVDSALVEALDVWRRRMQHQPLTYPRRGVFLAGTAVAALIHDDGIDPMVNAPELPLALIRAPLTPPPVPVATPAARPADLTTASLDWLLDRQRHLAAWVDKWGAESPQARDEARELDLVQAELVRRGRQVSGRAE